VSGEKKWYGLPPGITTKPTIPARRDELEIRLLMLLDVLTAYASNVEAGGRALVMAALLALRDEPGTSIALLDEVVDENGNSQGWRLAGARASLPLADVVMQPVIRRVRLVEMREPAARVRAAHRLAADLLGIFGIDQPGVLIGEGTLDPAGTGTDHEQMVYQHAQHLGLRLPKISPAERRQRLEAAIRSAQEEYRRR
jgi:hypothetical protein